MREELDGHRLIINRSIWRNFPTIRCERWTHGKIALIGDAKATAHFSIGSGTKLAMEDAIALYQSFRATGGAMSLPRSTHFEIAAARRGREDAALGRRVAGLVRARQALLDMDAGGAFAFGLMTRSKAITYDNLALARAGVRRGGRPAGRATRSPRKALTWRRHRPAATDVPAIPPARHGAGQPLRRLADVPILRDRGLPNDWHLVHYGSRAHRRCGADVHRDDVRFGRGAHHARLRRPLYRCAGGGLDAHRRFRPCQSADEILPAARPCRAQGRDPADVGGHGSAAADGAWPIMSASPLPYLSAQPGAARNDARRHGRRDRRFRAGRRSAASAPASTCWNCTPHTAICWRASSRR